MPGATFEWGGNNGAAVGPGLADARGMTSSAAPGPAADLPPVRRPAPGGTAPPRGAPAGAGQDFAGLLALAGDGQTGGPNAPAGQPQAPAPATGGASALPAPAPSLPGPTVAGPLPPDVPALPGATPGAVPARLAAVIRVDSGKPMQGADEGAPALERGASKADAAASSGAASPEAASPGAASSGPALLPDLPASAGLNWPGQAASTGSAAQPGATPTAGEGASVPVLDAAASQGTGHLPAGPSAPDGGAPGVAALRQQAGLSFAGAAPGPAPPAVPPVAGVPAITGRAQGGEAQLPPDPVGAGDRAATLQVKSVQVSIARGTMAPKAANSGIPGASSLPLADGEAPAQQDDNLQPSSALPPGGSRPAAAALKVSMPASGVQTEPSGAAAQEHTPDATGPAAPPLAGDLTGQAAGLSFLMPASAASSGAAIAAPTQATGSTRAAPAPPAPDQLRPAFAAAASPTGPSRVVVRLDPAELGRVQVGIVRQPDGPSRIELVAERPETLQLLMRDQPALHRALDLAGVPAEGRTLHFQVGSPDPAPTPPAPQPGLTGGSMNSSGGGSQPGSGRSQPPGWSGPALRGDEPDAALSHPAFRSPHGRRAGVDITA